MKALADFTEIDAGKLLLNHLEFLRLHRGQVSFSHNAWMIDSEKEAFTFVIPEPGSSVAALVARHATFYLTPACLRFEKELKQMGFVERGALNYMTMKLNDFERKGDDIIEIRKAQDPSDLLLFSEIQSKAAGYVGIQHKEWLQWLQESNLRNFEDPLQSFYIASLGNERVGAALALFDDPVTGIFINSTIAKWKNHGAETALVNSIAEDSMKKGIEVMALQVAHGSRDEFFFQRNGFKSSFLVKIMARN